MDRERYEQLIGAELDGELSEEQRGELQEAVAGDDEISRLSRLDRAVVAMLAVRGPERAPESLAADVARRLSAEAPLASRRPEVAPDEHAGSSTVRARSRTRAAPSWFSAFFGQPALRWGFGLALPAIVVFMLLEVYRQTSLTTPDPSPRRMAGAQRTRSPIPIAGEEREVAVAAEPSAPAETTAPVEPSRQVSVASLPSPASLAEPPPSETAFEDAEPRATFAFEPTPAPLAGRSLVEAGEESRKFEPIPLSGPGEPGAGASEPADPARTQPAAPISGEEENLTDRVWSPPVARGPPGPQRRVAQAGEAAEASSVPEPPRIDPAFLPPAPGTRPTNRRPTQPTATRAPHLEIVLAAASPPRAATPSAARPRLRRSSDPTVRGLVEASGTADASGGTPDAKRIEIELSRHGELISRIPAASPDGTAITTLRYRMTATGLANFAAALERLRVARTSGAAAAGSGSRYFFTTGSPPSPPAPGQASARPERTFEVEITLRSSR